MPRSPRPLDPDAGPVQAFAAELRELWERAGKPTFLQMARKTGRSRTAMSEATGGDHLPTWETVAAFVTACGDKPDSWLEKWELARDTRTAFDRNKAEQNRAAESAQALSEAKPQTVVATSRAHYRLRRVLPFAIVALAAATIASAATAASIEISSSSTSRHTVTAARQHPRAVVIAVQNKVALGTNSLVEDTTPAYLSSKPIAYCARYGCEVLGTKVSSGALLVAICIIHGQEMYNYNVDTAASQRNPNRVRSDLWYRIVYPDGRSGYLSEVYVVAADRGGIGLVLCR